MIQTGISFGELHSFRDLDLILWDVEIPPASPKETFVDIPGADGSVDMTEALGEVKFSDRTGAKFTFYMNPAGDLSDSAWEAKKKEISNLLNGWRGNITLDKDPAYYWQGRCNVSDHSSSKKKRKFVVGARLAPYKLKTDVTREIVYLCGKNLLNAAKYTNVYDHSDAVYYENGTVYVKYTNYNSLMLFFDPVPVNPMNKYAFRYDVAGGDRIVISFFDKDGNNISEHGSSTGIYNELYSGRYAAAKNGLQITMLPDVASIQIGLCAMNTVGEGNFNEYSNIQLEIGEAVTEFEPYTPNTEPQEITLTNARKTVCPVIECTGETKLEFSGSEINLSEGAHKVLALQLKEGETPVTVSGTGAVTFAYQEGDL